MVADLVEHNVMFGATAGKIAAMLKCSSDIAQKIIDKYWENAAGLGTVRTICTNSSKYEGHIVGLDGRILPTRAVHSALNTKIQSEEAIFMKLAFREIDRASKDWHIVMHMHDEWLVEIPDTPEEREKYNSFVKQLGEKLTSDWNYSVPVEFDTAFGYNYAECH